MNSIDLTNFLPLSDVETIQKKIYFENPKLCLDKPQPINQIDSALNNIEKVELRYLLNEHARKPNEFMNENLFPSKNDVGVRLHTRYSPCFLHSHSFYEIIFILNGSCINSIASQSIEMKKGDVCIIAPGTVHAISVFNDNCIVMNLLIRTSTFENAFFGILRYNDILSSFFSRTLYSPTSESYLLFTLGNDSQIINYILDIYDEYNSNEKYSERMLNIMTTSLFIRLLRTDDKNIIIPNPLGNSTDKNILTILNYLFTNYKEITLKQLSSAFNYSERQMARILKDYTGKTFINIIQDIKIQRACELLTNPDISIQKIIDIVGYSNNSHFYKVFDKYYNMSPKDYRDKYLKI